MILGWRHRRPPPLYIPPAPRGPVGAFCTRCGVRGGHVEGCSRPPCPISAVCQVDHLRRKGRKRR